MGRRETENIWAKIFPENLFLSHLNQEKLEGHQSWKKRSLYSRRLTRDSSHEAPAQPCGDLEAKALREERQLLVPPSPEPAGGALGTERL